MVKYKSTKKNNFYNKNRRSKKLRKYIQKGASATASAYGPGVTWGKELRYLTFIRFLLYIGFRVGYKLDGENRLTQPNFGFDVDSKHDNLLTNSAIMDEDSSLNDMGVTNPSFLVNYIHLIENVTVKPSIWEFDYTLSSSNKDYTDYIYNLQGRGSTRAAATQYDAGLFEPAPPATHDTPNHTVLDTDGTVSALINTAGSGHSLTIPYFGFNATTTGGEFSYPVPDVAPESAAGDKDAKFVLPIDHYWQLMMIFIKSLVICGNPQMAEVGVQYDFTTDDHYEACRLLSSLLCRRMRNPSRIELNVPPKTEYWYSMTGEDSLSQALLAPYVGGNGRSTKSLKSPLLVGLKKWMNDTSISEPIQRILFRILKFMGDNQYIFDALIRIWATGKSEIIRTIDRPLAGRVQNVIQSISDNKPEGPGNIFTPLYDYFIPIFLKGTFFEQMPQTLRTYSDNENVQQMIKDNFDKKLWLYVSKNRKQHNVFMTDPNYINLESNILFRSTCKNIIRIVGIGDKTKAYIAAIEREKNMIEDYTTTIWNYVEISTFIGTFTPTKQVIPAEIQHEFAKYQFYIVSEVTKITTDNKIIEEKMYKSLIDNLQTKRDELIPFFVYYEKIVKYTKIFTFLIELWQNVPTDVLQVLQFNNSKAGRAASKNNPMLNWILPNSRKKKIYWDTKERNLSIGIPQISIKNPQPSGLFFDYYTVLVNELNKLANEHNATKSTLTDELTSLICSEATAVSKFLHLYSLIINFVNFFNIEMIKLILNGGLSNMHPSATFDKPNYIIDISVEEENNSLEARTMVRDGTQPNVLVNNYARIKKRFVDGLLFYGLPEKGDPVTVYDIESYDENDAAAYARAVKGYIEATADLKEAQEKFDSLSKKDKEQRKAALEDKVKAKDKLKTHANNKKIYGSIKLDKNYNIFEITAIIFMRSDTRQMSNLKHLFYLRSNLNSFEKTYVNNMVSMYATFVKFLKYSWPVYYGDSDTSLIHNDLKKSFASTKYKIQLSPTYILNAYTLGNNFYNSCEIQLGAKTTVSDNNSHKITASFTKVTPPPMTSSKYLNYRQNEPNSMGQYELCWFKSEDGEFIESVLNSDGSLNKNFYAGHVIDG